MDQKQKDQYDGRLAALEVILAQTLCLAIRQTNDPALFVEEMKKFLMERKDRLNPQAYHYMMDCFERTAGNVPATVKMISEEERRLSGQ